MISILYNNLGQCSIPVDAPLWLYLGDGRILYILKPQVFLEMSLVYAHRHRHVSIAMQGSMGTTRKPLATPPKVTLKINKLIQYANFSYLPYSVLMCSALT